jgi:tRNA (guanine37-N1)-methyltransferase
MSAKRMAFVTIYPKVIESYLSCGIFRSALASHQVAIDVVDLRDFACDRHGTIDDAPFGGGDGMIMRADCLSDACESIMGRWAERANVMMPSPQGRLWTQDLAISWSKNFHNTIIICGRFGGVDYRFIDAYQVEELSLGDVVFAGGELPGLLMMESCLRYWPGVLGHGESALMDSFGTGLKGRLEAPSYTRPQVWKLNKVPDVLLSGDHQAIENWRQDESLRVTAQKRPDLLK